MKVERIFYRLSILVFLVSGLGGASLSLYSYIQAEDWQETVNFTYDAMNKGYADCEKSPDSLACGLISDRRESFEHSLEKRDQYQNASKFWLKISLVMPLAVTFLFYSLRWVFTGKVRPFRVGAKKE